MSWFIQLLLAQRHHTICRICLLICLFIYVALSQMPETASKSIHNWQRYPSSNCYKIDEAVQFWIWQSVVAPSDTAEKNRNMGAPLQSFTLAYNLQNLWIDSEATFWLDSLPQTRMKLLSYVVRIYITASRRCPVISPASAYRIWLLSTATASWYNTVTHTRRNQNAGSCVHQQPAWLL